jgi:hypothetical protein
MTSLQLSMHASSDKTKEASAAVEVVIRWFSAVTHTVKPSASMMGCSMLWWLQQARRADSDMACWSWLPQSARKQNT